MLGSGRLVPDQFVSERPTVVVVRVPEEEPPMTVTEPVEAESTDVQPALPDLDLPDHHGHKPVGMKTKVNGAGNRITRPHEIEGRSGLRLLEGLRQAYRLADDERHGRKSLPGVGDQAAVLGPQGWTDASGRLLDEDELAEIRGDAVLSSVNDASLDPPIPLTAEEEAARLEAEEEAALAAEDADAAAEVMGPRHLRAVPDDAVGYDGLTVAQIIAAVRATSDAGVLSAVYDYESTHRNRVKVLGALSHRSAELA